MAVNIYDELAALAGRISTLETQTSALEAKVAALTKPKAQVAPVTYFRDTVAWDKVLAAKAGLAMFNPGNGPGTYASSFYTAQAQRCRDAGVPVYGYVYSDYGQRAAATVKADIDKHIAWYGVNGIFVDETANTTAALPYYTDLCAYIHGKGCKVVLNPGTKTIEAYAPLADHIMVSETDAVTYKGQTRPAWEANYPASKFWHCVHTCPAADMPAIVALAKSRNAGLIYVTGDVMANPYDTLCSYWDSLCTEVAKV